MIYVLMIITLSFGSILSFQSNELNFVFLVYYTISIFILKSFFTGDDFFISFQEKLAQVTDKKIIVAGQEISSNTERDKQEDRFLNFFEGKRLIKRKFLNVVLIGSYGYVIYKTGTGVSVSTIIPLFCSFIILNSFYIGHLLTALTLNIFLVAYNYSPDVAFGPYFIYICLIIANLFLVSKHDAKIDRKKTINLIILGGLFISLCFVFKWIIPNSSHSHSIKKALTKSQSINLRNFVNNSENELALFEGKLSGLKGMEDLVAKTLKSKMDIDKIKKTINASVMSDLEKAQLRQNVIDLIDTHQSIQESLELLDKQRTTQQSLSLNEQEILSNFILRNDGKLSHEEREVLENYANRNIHNGGATKNEDVVQKILANNGLNGDQKEELAEQLDQIIQANKQMVKSSNSRKIDDSDVLKVFDAKKQIPGIIERLKKIFPFLAGILLMAFIYYLLSKKGIKRVEVADAHLLNELQQEWRALRKLKLTPRQEVIHYYNLFHFSLQKIHYSDRETPPSCIVYEDMKVNNLDLEKSTLMITEVFAQCFYGDKNVTKEALHQYRKAIARILQFYQLN